jgi:choline dehydrogenase-like flavoprotein
MAGGGRVEQCEVCVVGTGAAGGILAYRLALAGLSVLSLEQGDPIREDYFTNHLSPGQEPLLGVTPDLPWDLHPAQGFYYANARAHALYARDDETSTSPASRRDFANYQVFRLNGKTNLWNAICLRFAPRDFRGRDHGDGDVNWPVGYGDLEPHYAAVVRLIGVCGTREGLAELPDGDFLPPLPLRPADKILRGAVKRIRDVSLRAVRVRKAAETRPDRENHCRGCGDCIYGCSSGSVYKFSSHLLPRLAGRANYRLLCGVKVARLLREPGTARIRAAECVETATGQTFRVEARTFVLCCGALETPRVLFNSRDEAFPDGLANGSGLVGCYLQDTVKAVLGTSLARLVGSRRPYDLGSNDALLIPRFLFDNRDFRGGYQMQFCHFLPRRPYYLDALGPLPAWLKRPVARLLFRSFAALLCFGKPEARRGNRVVPGRHRDRHGVPQVDVQYAAADNDRRMQRSMVHFGRRILRACSGAVVDAFVDAQPGRSIHYAGTCRMAAERGGGVVDRDLRAFDHPNLYLCDGSVLPELSEKNLTLSIMALAHRLADHLAAGRLPAPLGPRGLPDRPAATDQSVGAEGDLPARVQQEAPPPAQGAEAGGGHQPR